ncbi:MAG: RecX family transcriptional regulator [Alistipes sp.]|nr:RecX family transcriptional regulator [Alistipes sp.]
MRKSEVDDEVVPRERKKKSAAEALNALMRLCSRAEKSSGDALRLMRTWGVEAREQQGVLDKLQEMRFIDDNRYAEAYTREKSAMAGWGARKIAQQLRLKGVSGEIISRVLKSLDSDEQAERIEEKLRRKLRTTKYNSLFDLRGKLLRYGLGLGYDYDMVIEAIDKVVPQE